MEFFDAIANMSALSFAQHMVNGISLGSLYALIAIGYTMVYGILLMINFAHGDIVMMACYFAFFGITAFHIPWYFTFIITIIMTALLGVLIERSAYRPLREAPKNSILISAIGASFLLENRRHRNSGNLPCNSCCNYYQPCSAAAHCKPYQNRYGHACGFQRLRNCQSNGH